MHKFVLGGLVIAAVMAAVGAAQADDGAYCREYQQRVTIGGEVHQTYGTACMQPDGSWKMVEPESAMLEQQQPVQVAQTTYVQQPVVYEEPVYVQRQYPVVYPSIGLDFGFNDWHGGGGGWHGGGGHGGGWRH